VAPPPGSKVPMTVEGYKTDLLFIPSI
jgi:hypothetical protein